MGRRNAVRPMLVACLALVLTPTVAVAQSQPQEPRRTPDFLFGPPHGAIGVRGSWTFASAGSDLFDFVTRQLTIDKSDFNAPGWGADVAWFLGPRIDTQVGVFMARASQGSEYRDLVDNNFLPIEQNTSLKTIHVTGSVRFALAPRGRDVSRFAWVPSRFVPYVGAGGGAIKYEFMQRGDFVDFQDSRVFTDVFRSEGWAPSVHAFAGADLQLFRALYGTIEGRYTKASGDLGAEFVNFDPIDLSGFRLSAGINVIF